MILIAVGFYLAWLYGRKTTGFKWSEYLVTLILPFLGLIVLVWQVGIDILFYYIACCFIGNIVEHIGGYAVHKILGHRLWTYHRLTIGGYTSLLSFPYWGMIGIVFLSFYKFFLE